MNVSCWIYPVVVCISPSIGTSQADPLLTSVRHVFAHQQSPLARSSDMFGRPQKV
jgi:hypothetical protein